MRVVILSARTGWHTDELIRALTARGHLAALLPYEGLIARVGVEAGLTSEQISILDADAVLARIIPGGSLEQLIYRVDALHWLARDAHVLRTGGLAGESWRACRQLAARDRTIG